MAESGRGREVVIHIPGLPGERGALKSPIKNKNKFATSCRAVSIFFNFQWQDFFVKYVLHCPFKSFDSIFYITGTELTEKGETCNERGWLPISSLAECNDSTEFFQTYYPSYVFKGEDTINYDYESDSPKVCYVDTFYYQSQGYFNTKQYHHSYSRELCTRPED